MSEAKDLSGAENNDLRREQRERCLLRWEKVSRDATDEVAPYGSSVDTTPAVFLEGATATEGFERAQRITISVGECLAPSRFFMLARGRGILGLQFTVMNFALAKRYDFAFGKSDDMSASFFKLHRRCSITCA